MQHKETVIVGAGQAGLATSYYLNQQGHEHIVLEKSERAGSAWRDRSWDSFRLVTPNWAFRMPGADYNGSDRDGFMARDAVIDFFETYANSNELPVQFNRPVHSVVAEGDGYLVSFGTDDVCKARNVVIATGFFQKPKRTAHAEKLSERILQMHSSMYRNPSSLPGGAVLVVGSGQSGCQIAHELLAAGRKVFLCVGTAGRVPRRYRGKDIIEWLELTGAFNLSADELPPGMGKFHGIPQLTGANGGYTINLHQLARDGAILLGHLRGGAGNQITLDSDLHNSLGQVDRFETEVTSMIDKFIEGSALEAPMEKLPELSDGYNQPVIETLDLEQENINTVVWATGYTFDYGMVKLPVLDQDGFPIQTKGVTRFPGLYFVGMPWMPAERSGFLIGVSESARYIASCVASRSRERIA